MTPRTDDPETTRRREAFTDAVCDELGLDRAAVAELTDGLLRMVGTVAHGVARPAGPVAALLVGLAAPRGERDTPVDVAAVRERMRRVEALVQDFQDLQERQA